MSTRPVTALVTEIWGVVPRIRPTRSASKPLVRERAVVRMATPTATLAMSMRV
ncbi:hypothetical protein D3C80_2237680 [compost metagenome]